MASDGKIIIKGFDWGPAATKVVINVGTDSDQIRNIETTLFVVKEERKNEKDTLNSERTVTDAYYSDEYGSRTENNGGFISLELGFSPEEGSPMFYDFATGFNKWFDYKLKVKFGDAKETVLNNEDFYFPEIKDVDLSGRFTGSEGHSLTYASFIPKNASAENLRPLVIWLHGMGEGGTDPLITLYGNKVTPLLLSSLTSQSGLSVPARPLLLSRLKRSMHTSAAA